MAGFVYVLSALASLACTVMLLMGYIRTRSFLLLWSGIGFLGFTLNNIILFIDLTLFAEVDLSFWRLVPSLIGAAIMIYGLIWDTI